MTCSRCQNFVKGRISNLEEVNSVEVRLKTGLAVIHSKKNISVNMISKCLGPKYSVKSEDRLNKEMIKKSKINQLTPLFITFLFIIFSTLYLSFQFQLNLQSSMQMFIGIFFIVFSFFKFLDYKGFPDSFKKYDPIAKRISGYAYIYPFLETALGIIFLMGWQLIIALLITIIILSFTTYGVIHSLNKKSQIECACLGTAIKLPMTEATLIENGIMLVMSSILLISHFN